MYFYDNFIPEHPYRKKMYEHFFELLKKHMYDDDNDKLQKMSLNIEKSIFNYTLKNTGLKEWNNLFQSYYHAKLVSVYSNLNPDSYLKNVNLIKRLKNKEFTEHQLVLLTAEEIFPEKYYKLQREYIESLPKFVQEKKQEDGILKCGKCKTYKTSYYQMQTRSADEPEFGLKSTLLITSWLCYWKNSCSPSLILKC